MRPRLDSGARDIHGRGMPSEDVLLSITSRHPATHAGLSEAGSAPSEMLQGFGGTTEIMKEIIGRSLGL